MIKKVLVTGGFGYVGSRLVPHLLSLGLEVSVLDAMLYSRAGLDALQNRPEFGGWASKFDFVEGDLRDPDAVGRAVRGADAVIHLAAISNDPTGQVDEVLTRQVNFDAVGMLISIAKSVGVKRFINASSSSVFGIQAAADVTERLEPEPLTFYSKYKMLSEWLVKAAAAPDFCAVNVRPATICGESPRQRFDLTVNKLTADALLKRVITVHGGNQRRPNVGMTDVVAFYAFLLGAEAGAISGQTFNFGFENHKVMEIAKIIRAELSDLDVEIRVEETVDHRDYHISSEKLGRCLAFKPTSSIAKEVRNLRRAIEDGLYPDPDAPAFHNMKSMRLARRATCYDFMAV